MAYPMYGNNNQYYLQNMQNLQDMKDRIENQMKQIQQSQMQMQQPVPQPTNLTQNFQITPTSTNAEMQAKYVSNVDEVKNTFVMSVGVFVNKELDTLWFKNVNGEIRTFSLNEIIEQDPKDLEIQRLKQELEEMKGMVGNANEFDNTDTTKQLENEKSTRVSSSKRSNAK